MSLAIIGAGLSGLALARTLQNSAIDYTVFEARQRPGGRILTTGAHDLGPTWFWPQDNPKMAQLLNELQLADFHQFTQGHSLYQTELGQPPQSFYNPNGYQDAHRITGGAACLINALCGQLKKPVLFNQSLTKITKLKAGVQLTFRTGNNSVQTYADQVVLCLPPRLIAHTIKFEPELDTPFIQTLNDTPTWMAWQVKAIVQYKNCFWRSNGLNGSAFCADSASLIGEVFDASDAELKNPALGLFLTPAGQKLITAAVNKQLANELPPSIAAQLIQHLSELFGPAAANPTQILLQNWHQEPFTSTLLDANPLQTHPIYSHPWLQLDQWEDRLFFCGSETASHFGGYMEGALDAAQRVAHSIIQTQVHL